MKPTDEYVVCSLEDAEAFADKRNITVTVSESDWEIIGKEIGETMKSNYVAEAPYHPGYEDAVITEPKPFLCGIYKSKPLTNEEITEVFDNTFKVRDFEDAFLKFARAIEKAHGIK
jgi:hypothetical protein